MVLRHDMLGSYTELNKDMELHVRRHGQKPNTGKGNWNCGANIRFKKEEVATPKLVATLVIR